MLNLLSYNSSSDSENEEKGEKAETQVLEPLPETSSISNLTKALCPAPDVVPTVSKRSSLFQIL